MYYIIFLMSSWKAGFEWTLNRLNSQLSQSDLLVSICWLSIIDQWWVTHQWWVIWRRHKKQKWEVKLESGTMSALSMSCTRPPHRSTCARVDDPATGVLSSFVLLHHCHCVVITSVIQAWFTIKKFTSKLSVQVRLIWNNEKWIFLKNNPYNYRYR